MLDSESEALAPLLAEMLLFHAALGRGYQSPIPPARALAFTSACPEKSLDNFTAAEAEFRRGHAARIEDELDELEELEKMPKDALKRAGNLGRLKKLRELKQAKYYVSWRSDSVDKTTLVEFIQKSYYGALMYLDPVGGRLASAMGSPTRLASDLSWTTLMEGSTDEAYVRNQSTGGASTFMLKGTNHRFAHFCCCHPAQIDRLRKRIQTTDSGRPGHGRTILLGGDPVASSNTSKAMLLALMEDVYALGANESNRRVQVEFSNISDWADFFKWRGQQLLDIKDLQPWHEKVLAGSTLTPDRATVYGARAALTYAFIRHISDGNRLLPSIPITMGPEDLRWAKRFAKELYRCSSSFDPMQERMRHLRPGGNHHITHEKLMRAKEVITDILNDSDEGKLSKRKIRSLRSEGVTQGLVNELVKQGYLLELRGREECRMGKTTRAYMLASESAGNDELESYHDLLEAEELFESNPSAVSDNQALLIYDRLQRKAAEFKDEHFLPAVPLSRMTSDEIEALPKLLKMFPESMVLRGRGRDPEPECLMDDDTPLDVEGCNLWVRYEPGTGHPFYNWQEAGKLDLGKYWNEAESPALVPG